MSDQDQERRKAERLARFEATLKSLSVEQLREMLKIARTFKTREETKGEGTDAENQVDSRKATDHLKRS